MNIPTKQVAKRKPKNEYLNNIELYNKILDHYEDIEKALAEGKTQPKLPNYMGEAILLICNNLMKSPNFCNYSYKDEMIGDGIENCIRSFYRFDPSKSMNPFAYFTQIAYFAAVRRLKYEKKQKQIKTEIIKNSGIIDSMDGIRQNSDDSEYTNTYLSFLQEHADLTPKVDDGSYKPLKKLTKFHQKKLKEREDIIKQLENLTVEEIITSIEDYSEEIQYDTEET